MKPRTPEPIDDRDDEPLDELQEALVQWLVEVALAEWRARDGADADDVRPPPTDVSKPPFT